MWGRYLRAFGFLAAVLPVVLASGCAQWFPAASAEISPGVYRVQVSGNAFASPKSLRQKIEKKANDLCQNRGYKEVSLPEHEFFQQNSYYGSYTHSAGYQVITKYIQCNDAAASVSSRFGSPFV